LFEIMYSKMDCQHLLQYVRAYSQHSQEKIAFVSSYVSRLLTGHSEGIGTVMNESGIIGELAVHCKFPEGCKEEESQSCYY
jgi:hypothetical protein